MKYKLVNKDIKNNYIRELLSERGIIDVESIIKPTQKSLLPPNLLDNIDLGAKTLKAACDDEKKILLVVDCDCDGYTSSAIIYSYIKLIYPNQHIDFVIHEGKQHGLEDTYESIIDSNIDYGLIILPDSSSNDYIYHEKLREALPQIKFLILDHHIVEEKISDCAILINNQSSEKYTNKDLTGAGVVYQFCRYFDDAFGYKAADQFIDLAALGICGDMGSMLSAENQYIIRTGFSNIKNFFFKTLVEKQNFPMEGIVNYTTVSFYISPLINAMIRIGSYEEKERMFLALVNGEEYIPSTKRGAAGVLEKRAIESARECGNARDRQNKIKEKAIEQIEYKIYKNNLLDNKILFIRLDEDDDFPSELNGLVAMGLAARFKRPTIVARLNEEGYVRGSARGLANSELKDFREFLNNSGIFEYNRGHANAFGTSILNKNLAAFHEYANVELAQLDVAEDVFDVNFERIAADSDIYDLINEIDDYKDIFGEENSIPVIYISDINLTKDEVKIIGSKKDTIKFEKFGITYVLFRAGDIIDEIEKYDNFKINVVGTAKINTYRNYETPQIIIKKCEIIDDSYGF